MDYLKLANGPVMWIACSLGPLLVLFQAAVFVKKSLKIRKEIGLTDEQIRTGIKGGFLSSIGPSLPILAGMISLLVVMGGPVSWFRLSYIGSVTYEFMAASFGTKAAGTTLGSADMTSAAFAAAVWVMSLGSIGFILFTALATPQLDKMVKKIAGGKKALVPMIVTSAMCAAFAYLGLEQAMNFDSKTIAFVAGFAIMCLLCTFNRRANKKWIKEWGFTTSMFAGMLISVCF